MLNDTWPLYIFIRTVIFALQWLGPACLASTAWTLSTTYPDLPTLTTFRLWCLAESVFFLFFLYYRTHLQRPASHPPPRTKKERKALFTQVRREVHDPDRFLSGWFRGEKVEDIGRDDLKDFINWAFWDGRADMAPGGFDEKELEYYMGKVETMMRKPFKQGRGSAKPLCLTMDPVVMECRTLFWYFLVSGVGCESGVRMRRWLMGGRCLYWIRFVMGCCGCMGFGITRPRLRVCESGRLDQRLGSSRHDRQLAIYRTGCVRTLRKADCLYSTSTASALV